MVPPFRKTFPSVGDMSADQKAFYRHWHEEWRRGNAVPVERQISYVFCYIYDVLRNQPAEIISELTRLKDAYRHEADPLPFYCAWWISDCYVVLGQYVKALTAFPDLPLTGRSSSNTDSLLSLKLMVGSRIAGKDLLTLIGPRVTAWGRNHLDDVARYLDVAVPAHEQNHHVDLLRGWASSSHKYPYFVFTGFNGTPTSLPCYSFSRNPKAIEFAASMAREAENTAREERQLPRVGESWIGEVAFFYELKEKLKEWQVVHHGQPVWLGQQHLDVFIPELGVAVEYQGSQHDQAVEFFGGEEAFRQTQRRDARKFRLCRRNGVRLIYARPGYNLEEVVRDILSSKPTA